MKQFPSSGIQPLGMQFVLPPIVVLTVFNNSSSTEFWRFSLMSLVLATLLFFIVESGWFVFRKTILKSQSSHPFWRDALIRIVADSKKKAILVSGLLLLSLVVGLINWGGNLLTGKSVAGFGSYFILSLLLHFYLAALFSVWHLFLAPRFLALSQTKKEHSTQ